MTAEEASHLKLVKLLAGSASFTLALDLQDIKANRLGERAMNRRGARLVKPCILVKLGHTGTRQW